MYEVNGYLTKDSVLALFKLVFLLNFVVFHNTFSLNAV
jgi:hypothetical protein